MHAQPLSMLTGRHAIRSGTYSVPYGGMAEGLTQWEVTMAESLSDAGYATALYGKWHLGSENGRLPNDQGFDEWYGIPRTNARGVVRDYARLFAADHAGAIDPGRTQGREEPRGKGL
ncbi:sulfatase-like hydrolase/transferase [Massilia cavernae]|uniref:Sulfatase N-terminal domain-containing protein n=1 Tax=Massilia cavernae TaxID=2320864 RepID=A0A418X7C1_9BURK|nr:sulfatase-like hydrolase/transferase [Massilia cavernae]RJG08351.1 hypothetical protein D3872_24255 [Massilia cavernae]